MNELIKTENFLKEIEDSQEICKALLQSPHYKKIGYEGICAIVERAKSLGVSPITALNGGMYFVHGKVEMTSSMMNQLIRSRGHSITKDKKSNDTICILHGKRRDNGDTWVESFSIQDAQKAGIYKNQWLKYPKDMLFARALSRLARQLFPDLILGCYVEGEISVESANTSDSECEEIQVEVSAAVSDEELAELQGYLANNSELYEKVMNFMRSKYNLEDLAKVPRDLFELALKKAKEQFEQSQNIAEA